jgi:hypothetical protein
MPLSAGDRIDLVRESATLLANYQYVDIDLILRQHGAEPDDYYQGGGAEYGYVVHILGTASDAVLEAVHEYVTRRADGTRPGQSPWSSSNLRLFCSHLAAHRREVGLVETSLREGYGVEGFVAHDSIEPSKEWQLVIESGLRDADAMVVFVHPGVATSLWCDQEIGWAMGRNIPVLPLNYGAHPHGFLGKLQDRMAEGVHPSVVAGQVADWLTKAPTLHGRMAASLSEAFMRSRSYDHTRELAGLLDRIAAYNEDELAALERAAKDNSQVRDCVIAGIKGPDWVRQFVMKRRGPTVSVPDPWSTPVDPWSSTEPPF